MWTHRFAPTESPRAPVPTDRFVDRSVLVLALIVGGVRVVLGLLHHEVFGVEATVALFVTIFAAAGLVSARRDNSIR